MCKVNKLNRHRVILISAELFLACMLFVDSFIRDIVSKSFLIGIVGVIFAVLYVYLGAVPENKRYLSDAIYTITIIGTLYYIVTYLLGLITGFYLNSNDLSFGGMFNNILGTALYIVVVELFRYLVVNNCKKDKAVMILLVVVLTLCDVSDNIYSSDFNNISSMINLIGFYVVPSAVKNVALTYVAVKVSYKPAIFYRFIFELPVYFVPIIPNVGEYLQTIFNIVVPVIFFYYFYLSYRHDTVKFNNRKLKIALTVLKYIIALLMVCFVALISGFFKYHLVVVGSGSMTPTIEKGDGIIVKKLSKEEAEKLQVGQILVFKNSGLVLVHRITKLTENEKGKLSFRTKGDFNDSEDGFLTSVDDVVGVANFKIPKIGLPTMWLREQSNF